MTAKTITRDDLLDLDTYGKERRHRRRALIDYKKPRRISVGPDATFYFENRETMWAQIQEMLWIEKGGDEQIDDELSAYNPLIPQGRELIATFMIEIDDPVRRAKTLQGLTGVEETITLSFAGETVTGVPEVSDDVDRTKEDGKTSSIHFIRFTFSDDQAAKFVSADQPPRQRTSPPARKTR